jgi:hypothetical protein
MIIAANQPYFAPYPGFFTKTLLADVLVILDEVQFPHRTTWISRNRFKNDQGELWLTIPVWKKGLGDQKINQVRICYERRWPRKHYFLIHIVFKVNFYQGSYSYIIFTDFVKLKEPCQN